MNKKQTPVIVTDIANLSIRSVLDNGFIEESEMAPEMHVHAFYELMIALDGEFCIELGDEANKAEPIILKPSSVCLIQPGVYHCTREISDAPTKLAIRFNFSEGEILTALYALWNMQMARLTG